MSKDVLLQRKQTFVGINLIRFIAACWVLIFHASIHFGKLDFLFILQPIIDQGVLAMSIFFILSGFVLSYRYRNFQTKQDVVLFYATRFAKLYPTYLFIGLITAWQLYNSSLDFLIIEHLGSTGKFLFFIGLFFLFLCLSQAWFPGLFSIWNFGGSWALSVEFFFYMLFPTIRTKLTSMSNYSLYRIICITPILIFLMLSGMIIFSANGKEMLYFYTFPIFRLPEFIFGIAGYILFIERAAFVDNLNKIFLFSSPLLLIAIMLKDLPGLIDYNFLAIIPFIGAIVFSLKIDFQNKLNCKINYLGSISYCLYMSQLLTIPILKKYKESMSIETAWILLIISTFFTAIFIYHLIEIKSYQFVLKRTKNALDLFNKESRLVSNVNNEKKDTRQG